MKEILRALVIVLILNVVGAIGYAGYSGMFSGPRLAAAWEAWRTEPMDKAVASAESQPAEPASRPSGALAEATSSRPAAEDPASREVARTGLDRREQEIEQQWAMLRAARLQLLRDREAWQKDKKESAMSPPAAEAPAGGEGYKKELEYLSSIRPKQAKDFLRLKKDADAVSILMALEPRVGRKIIDACKTQEERLWMGRVLEELRQRDDRQAEVLAAGAP